MVGLGYVENVKAKRWYFVDCAMRCGDSRLLAALCDIGDGPPIAL